MSARRDIKRILVIGSGPIVIGQACEFDYSGTQAVKALKEEGYEVILLNPNPATVMTTPGMADHIYLDPLRVEYVEQIFQRERPDAILTTMGGQSGLNLALELDESGLLEQYGFRSLALPSHPSNSRKTVELSSRSSKAWDWKAQRAQSSTTWRREWDSLRISPSP